MMKKFNKKVLSVMLTFALMISLFTGLSTTANAMDTWDGTSSSTNWDGSGTLINPYLIDTCAELKGLANSVNAGNSYSGYYFQLDDDLNLNNYAWTPIGQVTISSDATTNSPYVSSGSGFAGTFDGDGKTISGLSVTVSSSGAGLFGFLAPSGTIQDLIVSGSVSASSSYDAIGGVVGYNSGIINEVTNNATVTASTGYNVGGIAGFNDNYYTTNSKGVIVNCHNTGDVTCKSKAGGIAGENAGTISSCSNTGDITNPTLGKNGAGGIAGRNGNNNTAVETGEIFDCYNTGTITVDDGKWCGGIVGFQNALSSVTNCYNIGSLDAYSYMNSIVGKNEGTTTYIYSLDSVYNISTGDGSEKGTSMTSAQMQDDVFLNTLNSNASANNIWNRDSSYPYLNDTAAIPTTTGGGTPNNYSVIYLSNSGDDSNTGSTSNDPVLTLGRAVALADMSTVTGVYISVQNTITISSEQSVFGGGTSIQWAGSTGPMFTIASGGDLTIGGLVIDGNSVSTVFSVANGGDLTVRNSSSISDCGTAINVAGGGDLILNRSSITGTTNSVYLASSTSSFTMYAADGQDITVTGTVYLASGAYIIVGFELTSTVTVQCASPASDVMVAQGTRNYALQIGDVDNFAYVGDAYSFYLDGNAIYTE